MTQQTKSAFFISPIKGDNSPERIRSNKVYDRVLKPVLEQFGYQIHRADMIANPGSINNVVIRRTITDDLVIADLSGLNPNVFYEVGLRHAAQKHCIHIMERNAAERPPFDVQMHNTYRYSLETPTDVQEFKEYLESLVKAVEEGVAVDNPVTPVIQSPIVTAPSAARQPAPARLERRPSDRILKRAKELLALAAERDDWQVPHGLRNLQGYPDAASRELDRATIGYLVDSGYINETAQDVHFLSNEGFEELEQLRTADLPAVQLDVTLSFFKRDVHPTVSQRVFYLNIFGENNRLNALEKYELQVSLPRTLVLPNQQTGTDIQPHIKQTMKLKFPISQDNPLPKLWSGKIERITKIMAIVHDHNLKEKDWIESQKLVVELFADGVTPIIKSIPLSEIDPFSLMRVTQNVLTHDSEHEYERIFVAP